MHPSFEALVDWWTGDLPADALDELELHLMGCDRCTREAERVGAVVRALRASIPIVVTRERLEALRRQGLRIEEHPFRPGVRQPAVFPRTLDLLVHRLGGLDLADVVSVGVRVESESSGPLTELPDVPFDRAAGEILVACQHHFKELPADIRFRVTAREASGRERESVFLVPHTFLDG